MIGPTPPRKHFLAEIKLKDADPFDRLLLAQCEVETLRFLTADRALADWPGVIRV